MNKRIIEIIIGLLVVMAIIISLLVFKPWASNNQDEGTQVDNSELAGEIEGYIDDMDKEEIEDTLDQEMNDEQLEIMDEIINKHSVPSVDEIDIDEDGTMTYTDNEGNTVIREPNEEIQGMTEDELAAENEKIDQTILDYINGNSGNPGDPGDEGNTGNNTKPNTGSNVGNTNNEQPEPDSENSHDTAMSEDELAEIFKQQMEQSGSIGAKNEITQEDKDWISGSINLEQ